MNSLFHYEILHSTIDLHWFSINFIRFCFFTSVWVQSPIINNKKNYSKEKSKSYSNTDRQKIVQIKNRKWANPEHGQYPRRSQYPYSIITRHWTFGILSLNIKKCKDKNEPNNNPIQEFHTYGSTKLSLLFKCPQYT